jgi:hypothetical protein
MYNFDVFSKAILDFWIGKIRSVVFSGKLSTLESLLHLVHLFYISNLKGLACVIMRKQPVS